jgi:hypothetical protein
MDKTPLAAEVDGMIVDANDMLYEAERALAFARSERDHQISRYNGWSRFFLCISTGGHIHSSTSCTTCTITTQFAWITELSGKTEAEAVDQLGEILCSVCFPTAPAEWTDGISNEAKVRRAAAVEARAERKVEEAAAAARVEARKVEAAAAAGTAAAALAGDTYKLNPTVAKLVDSSDRVTLTEARQSIYRAAELVYDVLFDGHCIATAYQTADGKFKGCGRMFNYPEGGGCAQSGKLKELREWIEEQVFDTLGKSHLA